MYPYNNQPLMIQPLSKMKQTTTIILHNFNHKSVGEQDEKKLRTKNNSEEDSSVKKRKKVVAR